MVVVGCSLGYVALNAIRRDLPVVAATATNGGPTEGAPTVAPTDGAPTVAPTPTAGPTAPPVDLRHLLLTPPANSRPVPDDISPDGTLTVEQAAGWLEWIAQDVASYGYKGGAVVRWRLDATGEEVAVLVLQFDGDGGAQFAANVINGDENSALLTTVGNASAQPPGSFVFASLGTDQNGFYETISIVPKASYFVEVVDLQRTKDTTAAQRVAAAQYAKLA
jgi:hypothetical protein